jgi:hypothetical protein
VTTSRDVVTNSSVAAPERRPPKDRRRFALFNLGFRPFYARRWQAELKLRRFLTSDGARSATIALGLFLIDVTMKRLRFLCAAAALIAASLALGGCGLFGCSGFATNGGGFGGCSVGTRF